MLKPKVVPLRDAAKFIGQVVEVKGTPRYVKTLSDGKEGYVIKGPNGKIMCSTPERLDGKPVVVKGRIKEVYGIVYLDVEKGEIKKGVAPVPKPEKGVKNVPKGVPLPPPKPMFEATETTPEQVEIETPPKPKPGEKIRLMVSPKEVDMLKKMKAEEKKKGFFAKIRRLFGRQRKATVEKGTPPLPKQEMMLPEEKKIRILKEAMKKAPQTRPEKPKKGFFARFRKEEKEETEIKPTGGFLGRLKLGKEKPLAPIPKGGSKVIVKRPEELMADKKRLLEKIKKEVPKKKAHVLIEKEKVQEVKWPPIAVKQKEGPKDLVVKKKIIKVAPKKGKIIEQGERDLPTKILGPQKDFRKAKEPVELKELEEPTKIVSEIKQVARTPIDHMLVTVKKKGSVGVDALAAELGVPESVIEDWARILEEHKLLSVKYPAIGKPKLVPYETSSKKIK